MPYDNQHQALPLAPLMFGIPQLDALMGYRQQENLSSSLTKPQDFYGSLLRTSSLSIVGEDGTGKSVFALHLASRYLALHYRAGKIPSVTHVPDNIPLVLYASSDFRFAAAQTVWQNFYLDYPWLRYVPFIDSDEKDFRATELGNLRTGGLQACLRIDLVPCKPTTLVQNIHDGKAKAKRSSARQAHFIDLADQSTGDDWRYLSSLLAALPRTKNSSRFDQPPNLLILDSVAGFETLIGDTNTFGQESTRRARISQILKAAGTSWHIVFVSEEPEQSRHHPEEYVTDTVIHLRRYGAQEKVRRFVEIEKSRARNLAQGEHPFEIRDGRGSSTRGWENPDDPRTSLHPDISEQLTSAISSTDDPRPHYTSYVQVFPSLHYLSKRYGARQALIRDVDPSPDRRSKIPFGIDYLDDLFLPSESETAGGLPASTLTALIGEEGTRKVYLAEEFLIAAYSQLPTVLDLFISLSQRYRANNEKQLAFTDFIRKEGTNFLRMMTDMRPLDMARLGERIQHFGEGLYDVPDLNRIARSSCSFRDIITILPPLRNRWSLNEYVNCDVRTEGVQPPDDVETTSILTIALSALRLLTGVLVPSVFVTTHDSSREALVSRMIKRYQSQLTKSIRAHLTIDDPMLDLCLKDLKRVVENWIIVRRIELIDATSPQLWHVIENAVIHGINGLGYNISDISSRVEPEVFAEQVRVVISDLRLLRDTYPAVAADPLFLPTIVFRLKRFGVTSLIVESDNGRFDEPPSHSMSGALRSLADHQVNTWKVNFFGEQRVAIAVLPSAGTSNACLIRELRYESKCDGDDVPKLIVDPGFEIFENIEDGKASAVALQVHLYNETPAFEQYVESERTAFDLIFRPEAKDTSGVLKILPHAEYSALRDYTNLPTTRKLPFTLVFMVDGYWALGHVNALANQHEYLFRRLPPDDAVIRFEDPFGLFFQSNRNRSDIPLSCRADTFKQTDATFENPNLSGYVHRVDKEFADIDRVPFMWDFGFLLCAKEQWDRARDSQLIIPSARNATAKMSVGEVFDRLKVSRQVKEQTGILTPNAPLTCVSWREFFEACTLVSRKEEALRQNPCGIFDVSSISPESITCMMLEIWLSEVFDDLTRFESFPKGELPALDAAMITWCDQTRRDIESLSSRVYGIAVRDKPRLQDWLQVNPSLASDISTALTQHTEDYGLNSLASQKVQELGDDVINVARRFSLVKAVGGFSVHLYQTWLLLLEVLRFSSFVDDSLIERSRSRMPDNSAVSVRHWYKTACISAAEPCKGSVDSLSASRTMIPVRLPGHFSARGDWFLASAKGSRSTRLAEQAIDLLSSRRANRTRLQLGLGLPVRDLVPGKEIGKIGTALSVTTATDSFRLSYENVLEMGGCFFSEKGGGPFVGASDFFWLFRTGLQNYDKQSVAVSRWLQKMFIWTVQLRYREAHKWDGGFKAYDQLRLGQIDLTKDYKSWNEFFEYLKVFQADLDACVHDDKR